MIPYETTKIQQWETQGYAPHDPELWAMLCGWLASQRGNEGFIAYAPDVVYPLSLDAPQMVTIRRYFVKHRVLPVEIIDDWIIRLAPEWQSKLQGMQRLMNEVMVFYHYLGVFPWDEEGCDVAFEL